MMSETVLFLVGNEAHSLTDVASLSPRLTAWTSLVVAAFYSGKSITNISGVKGFKR